MATAGKPNILVIWGDDIGVHNISAYNHGILPTAHGFDEFFGNLYHLNAEEDPRPITNARMFRIHADGHNFLPYFRGEAAKGPRQEIYYFSRGGERNAIRVQDWKIHFATQIGHIATGTRATPGWPPLVNLRADPYEKGAAALKRLHELESLALPGA